MVIPDCTAGSSLESDDGSSPFREGAYVMKELDVEQRPTKTRIQKSKQRMGPKPPLIERRADGSWVVNHEMRVPLIIWGLAALAAVVFTPQWPFVAGALAALRNFLGKWI